MKKIVMTAGLLTGTLSLLCC